MKKSISIILVLVLLLSGCSNPRKEDGSATADMKWDMIPAVMVEESLYITTGYSSSITNRPETPQGTITSEVPGSELPTENDQSNFGTGFEYNLGYINGTVEVKTNDQWWIYAEESIKQSGLYKQKYISFDTQDTALKAHESMLAHFGWDMNYETVGQYLPTNYGGCYINEDNVFCVCLVSPTEQDMETFLTACGTKEIYIQPVTYTLSQLMDASNAIGTYNETHETPICLSWGTDEMNNCVSITVAEDMAEEAEALRKEHPCIQYELDIPTLSPAEHPDEKSREDVLLIADIATFPTNIENLSFVLQNNSPQTIAFPHKYLEILIDNAWYTIPYRSDVAFTTELPFLNAGGSSTVGESFAIRNFDFIPGTYRFGIGYCYDEDYNGKNANYIAWAVFEMQ